MITRTLVKEGQYYDSVTLLQVAQTLLEVEGVEDAAVVMATPANKGILDNAQLLTPEAEAASLDDLVIAVRATTETAITTALDRAQAALTGSEAASVETQAAPKPKTVEAAVSSLNGANIALISVAGRYAADVARDALKAGLHVFLFSDNVSVEDEVALKQMGRERGLLVMGPDAGTAIINGYALGFANDIVVTRPADETSAASGATGGVGIVAASGTGLQAVTTILAQRGVGVTQAIGTGGRDLSVEVGGIMMVESIRALQADPNTQVLLLVSKPPAPEVAETVLATLQDSAKPTVVCFLGGKKRPIREAGAIAATDLEKAALIAAEIAVGGDADQALKTLKQRNRDLKAQAKELKATLSSGQRYYRGLFSGGTFCYETQLILGKRWPQVQVYSNAPLNPENQLESASVSVGHTAVDLGADEFTVGRLHPMLDPAMRNRRLVHEARDPETAIIYIDVVLGYGVHPNPAGAAVEAIREAQVYLDRAGRDVIFLAHVCGTDADPQNAAKQREILEDAGVLVLPTNAAAARLAAAILG